MTERLRFGDEIAALPNDLATRLLQAVADLYDAPDGTTIRQLREQAGILYTRAHIMNAIQHIKRTPVGSRYEDVCGRLGIALEVVYSGDEPDGTTVGAVKERAGILAGLPAIRDCLELMR